MKEKEGYELSPDFLDFPVWDVSEHKKDFLEELDDFIKLILKENEELTRKDGPSYFESFYNKPWVKKPVKNLNIPRIPKEENLEELINEIEEAWQEKIKKEEKTFDELLKDEIFKEFIRLDELQKECIDKIKDISERKKILQQQYDDSK